MFFRVLVFIGCFVIAAPSWSQSALETLDQEPVSRLDLAMVRLSQKVLEYEMEKESQEYGAFDLNFAMVRFNNSGKQIEFLAQVQADPTEFYCELALRDFMKKFHFGGTPDGAAKSFYSMFFMPAASSAHSYEVDLYRSVYQSTVFRVVIVDSDIKRKFECNFDGSNPKITYTKM